MHYGNRSRIEPGVTLQVMMPPTQTRLLTVEEFAKIADPASGHYELHHGELVLMPPPIYKHYKLQRKFMRALDRICIGWVVGLEFPFRPLPEHEVWRADVGMVTEERSRAISETGWLEGSPDLVIEVLSPSNTVEEINDRERICFQGGCLEFWLVDPKWQTIRVSTPDGQGRTYGIADEVPLDRFVAAKLSVAEVFAD